MYLSTNHWFYFLILATVALLSIPPVTQGELILNPHHSDPSELDVYSRNNTGGIASRSEPCIYNRMEDFVGEAGTNFFTVEYFYTMEVNATLIDNVVNIFTPRTQAIILDEFANNSLRNVILSVESSIASYLMEESYTFENATCSGHGGNLVVNVDGMEQMQANSTESRYGGQENSRPSKNVGITIAPNYEPALKCISTAEDVLCYEIAGAFQVHTVGETHNITQAKIDIRYDLQAAMEKGKFDRAHPSILNLTFLDSISPNFPDGTLSEEVPSIPINDNGNNAVLQEDETNVALIIGGSIGGILLLLCSFIGIRCCRCNRHQDGMDGSFEPSTIV
ncbi:hypothetical protein FRACYDRAFT_234212 [Fragilariopsis cylindrus CCMP1102]|uniref:Uncharacterized protein n=1 Tax=Fragilariopsis cylindrus CCMP1102 TaxID=635003 RepID=A0A1E7FQY5_9STRA|nr:hypothetical protein FRACYDRAFT_234212 [Fragilariopsis cylindrus CCMP1102]|eukprot:OEU20581.1 hypothetical protein FRACYDRAFT_234212 [Fragilariopsis cylindrus CCMP1102]